MLDELYLRITRSAEEKILREKQRLERQRAVLPLLFTNLIQGRQNRLVLLAQRLSGTAIQRLKSEPSRLQLLQQRLVSNVTQRIEREEHRLQLMKQRFESLDPRLLLKRGYSITTCGGRVVRSIENLTEGEVLTTNIEDGEIYSKVIICKKN